VAQTINFVKKEWVTIYSIKKKMNLHTAASFFFFEPTLEVSVSDLADISSTLCTEHTGFS
jgi:hypothetical protein